VAYVSLPSTSLHALHAFCQSNLIYTYVNRFQLPYSSTITVVWDSIHESDFLTDRRSLCSFYIHKKIISKISLLFLDYAHMPPSRFSIFPVLFLILTLIFEFHLRCNRLFNGLYIISQLLDLLLIPFVLLFSLFRHFLTFLVIVILQTIHPTTIHLQKASLG